MIEAEMGLRDCRLRAKGLSADSQERIRSLPIGQLEALGDALLAFRGAADLDAWLNSA